MNRAKREVTEFKKPTSTEGDAWKGKKTMCFKKAIEIGDKVYKKEHPNAKTYKMMQNIIILRQLKKYQTKQKASKVIIYTGILIIWGLETNRSEIPSILVDKSLKIYFF